MLLRLPCIWPLWILGGSQGALLCRPACPPANVGPALKREGICMPVMFRRGCWLFKTVGKRAFLLRNSPIFTHSWGGHIELIIIANYNGSLCGIWDLGGCQIALGACVDMHMCESFFIFFFFCEWKKLMNLLTLRLKCIVMYYKITISPLKIEFYSAHNNHRKSQIPM